MCCNAFGTLFFYYFIMEEVWKDVVGFEGRYLISNMGRCRTLVQGKNTIMKPWIEGSWYSFLHLRKWGNSYNLKLHRAVMFAFVWEDEVRKFVNHKDWNKQNNKLDNLEWVTRSENDKHRYRILWYKTPFQINPYMKWVYWEWHPLSKKIKQYSLDWEFIKEWTWINQMCRELWISGSCISQCCKWKYSQSWWYKWSY